MWCERLLRAERTPLKSGKGLGRLGHQVTRLSSSLLIFDYFFVMAEKKRQILAFGASLTAGFCHGGRSEHPYSLRLQELIDASSTPSYTVIFTF